jgi:hypothetical protein
MQRADPNRPTAGVLFYRAHLVSGNLAFVDDLVDALEDAGLNALAVFTSSLRVREKGLPAALQIVGRRAAVLISTLSFALGDQAGDEGPSALDRLGVPIIQAITSGMPREAWEVSLRGLTALDTAINVAIPDSTAASCRCRSRSGSVEGRGDSMRRTPTASHVAGLAGAWRGWGHSRDPRCASRASLPTPAPRRRRSATPSAWMRPRVS